MLTHENVILIHVIDLRMFTELVTRMEFTKFLTKTLQASFTMYKVLYQTPLWFTYCYYPTALWELFDPLLNKYVYQYVYNKGEHPDKSMYGYVLANAVNALVYCRSNIELLLLLLWIQLGCL